MIFFTVHDLRLIQADFADLGIEILIDLGDLGVLESLIGA